MKKKQFLSRRVYLLIAVMGLWGTVIGTRLYFLQVVHSEGYRKSAKKQQQQALDIMPPRGVFYDRNGRTLAASINVRSVFAVPQEIVDPDATARTLAAITGLANSEIADDLHSKRKFVWIKRKVSTAEASAIERAKLPGIHFEEESRRFYPNGALASQVLGYVGVDNLGLGGLEGRYDASVRGEVGSVVYLSDGHGRSFNQVETPALAGANLQTTIDKNIQYFVEQEIREAEERTHATWISIVVMDPRNGEILAMANYPSFDPNNSKDFSLESRSNGAISHTYEPGSTFKVLTVAAALEENLTNPEERIDCLMGSIVVAGSRIRDHKPFGVLTVSEILQNSSDVGAITLGMRLHEDRMAKYIKLFGFGKNTGIDLPGEERGLTKPISQWEKASIGYISMGQAIGVTPLQIASMISVVANGGTLYRPYVVKEVQDVQRKEVTRTEPSGERVLSAKSAQNMKAMLEEVVIAGTAKSARLDGYRAAGKTGTAQKRDDRTGKYSETKLVASFAGFAPVSNPSIAMVVVVDEPVGAHHGGEVAAPIFKNIADQILHYKGIAPDVQDYAPRYTAKPAARPSAPSINVRTQGAGELKIVNVDFVERAARTSPFERGDVPVPDFRGKSLRQIGVEAKRLGLEPKTEGNGRAIDQYPPAGSLVRLGTTVELRLSTTK